MRIRIGNIMRRKGMLTIAACASVLAGCETSSSSKAPVIPFGDNDPNVIVAMGDSVTRGTAISGPSYPQLVADWSGKTVINEGVGGALSSDGVNRIAGVLERENPGFVFILYGINDNIHVGSDNWTIANLREMIRLARENQTYPIVGTIPPRFQSNGENRHAGLNQRIRDLCNEEDVVLADVDRAFDNNPDLLLEDGFHPNEAGNQIIATVFYETLP